MVGANFVTLAEQAVKENHSHVRYLEALLAMECEERDRHAIENRIRDAQLPRVKTLEEFDFSQAPQIQAARIRELAEGGYIERSEPVVLIGECGTGKSHLATGLCLAACRQKRRVRFYVESKRRPLFIIDTVVCDGQELRDDPDAASVTRTFPRSGISR